MTVISFLSITLTTVLYVHILLYLSSFYSFVHEYQCYNLKFVFLIMKCYTLYCRNNEFVLINILISLTNDLISVNVFELLYTC